MSIIQHATEGKSASVLEIFKTMSYNEASSPVTNNFMSFFNGALNSVVDGEILPNVGEDFEIYAGIKLICATRNFIDEYLKKCSIPLTFEAEQSHGLDTVHEERLLKLRSFLNADAANLCLAESAATGIPVWQIELYDLPMWKDQLLQSRVPRTESTDLKLIAFVFGNRNGVSITLQLLTLLQSMVSCERVVILATPLDDSDRVHFIQFVYLIQAINKIKIWAKPMDILLLKGVSDLQGIIVSKVDSGPTKMHLWTRDTFSKTLPLEPLISSGVFSSNGDDEGHCVQYIFDLTADLETGVEGIAAHMWASGSQMRFRELALLFVHESVQVRVIDLFSNSIKPDLSSSRGVPPVMGSLLSTIKTIPVGSDLSKPTLVYNIGTSSPLISGNDRDSMGSPALFLIPYRNTSELISLANNFGGIDKSISLFTSNPSLIPAFSTSVKALGGIWINTLPQQQIPATLHNFGVILNPSLPTVATLTQNKVNWKSVTEIAEKGFQTWSNTKVEERYLKVVFAFSKMIENVASDAAMLEFAWVMGRGMEDSSHQKGGLTAYHRQPRGIVAIILSDRNIRLSVLIRVMALALGKGNAVLLVSVGAEENTNDLKCMKEFGADFPVGILQLLRVGNLDEAFIGLAQEGKVSLVWILHSGIGLNLSSIEIPKNAFQQILVDDSTTIDGRLKSRALQLELTTPVYIS